MDALSLWVHGGASVFDTAGILGGGSIAAAVARCQQRPGHDAYHQSRVLQRHLRSLAKRLGRPLCGQRLRRSQQHR